MRYLKTTLLVNSLFSLGSGLVTIIWQDWLGRQIGLNPMWLLTIVGLGLIGFGSYVLWTTINTGPKQVRLIIWADWGWVIASLILLTICWSQIPLSGKWIIDGVAIMVASFAILQKRYLSVVNQKC